MAEFETFEGGKVQEGAEFELELIDRGTMERFRARVRAAKDAARLPGAERLWARQGHLGDIQTLAEWWIRIISRDGEEQEEPEIRRRPPPIRERAGFLLRSLIKERQEREEEQASAQPEQVKQDKQTGEKG